MTFLVSLRALAGCAGTEPTAIPRRRRAGKWLTTMDAVVDPMRDTAGECPDVTTQDLAALREFVGPDIAARFEPYVAEWVTCAVSAEFPRMGLALFDGDAQRKFQESWHGTMAEGEVADGRPSPSVTGSRSRPGRSAGAGSDCTGSAAPSPTRRSTGIPGRRGGLRSRQR